MKRYVLAITGASGPVLGIRTIEHLIKSADVFLVMSLQSFAIIRHETGLDWTGKTDAEVEKKVRAYFNSDRIQYFNELQLDAPFSSGSFQTSGMLVVPCSMKTLSGIANGYSDNLISRAADVTIKEGRRLLISPREMPFSAIHLENMLKLARLGVTIAPPVPAFYHSPEKLNDLVDFTVGKILDSFNIEHRLFRQWEGMAE